MKNTFRVISIVGSPHGKNSNTLALIEDFIEELKLAGVSLEHEAISLGQVEVKPCIGCWNCTKNNRCPLAGDQLSTIKKAMLNCDMLILGSPVYTNQVSAQMKALFDRLFTWCHIFPLLGKYSLSIVTTGDDGGRQTVDFLEKMLATYGTFSFGSIIGKGAYTPGFFPKRKEARTEIKKIASRAAKLILKNELPPQTGWQKKMFSVMKKKITGVHTVSFIMNGAVEGIPDPPRLYVKMLKAAIRKKGIPREDTLRLSKLMGFELDWWRNMNWLNAKSIKDLMNADIRNGFDPVAKLLPEVKL